MYIYFYTKHIYFVLNGCDIYLLKSVYDITFFTDSNFDNDEQVYCIRCVRGFITKGDPTKPFVDARRVHRSFNCVQCGERFDPSNSQKRNYLKYTDKKSFDCTECS